MTLIRTLLLALALSAICAPTRAQGSADQHTDPGEANEHPFTFAVSGDSRNCGDIVMPAIAEGVRKNAAQFYWHLGDFRALYDFDEDMQHQPEHIAKPMSIATYETIAWEDFIQNQIAPFGSTPVFLGVGNHEMVPPHTREQFIIQFADWLDSPTLRRQRLADNPNDHKLKSYYRWILSGVDFINLDNATDDQFDDAQVQWFEGVMKADASNPKITTIVAGMHKALPESISKWHSMNETPVGTESGRRVYADLLKAQNDAHKHVYVLGSHSHFYMGNVFNTEYWKANGGVLPGWIVGTAGAVRYKLPAESVNASSPETNVYGFLIGTLKNGGEIEFKFRHVNESDVPAPVVERYKQEFVHWCFDKNSQAK